MTAGLLCCSANWSSESKFMQGRNMKQVQCCINARAALKAAFELAGLFLGKDMRQESVHFGPVSVRLNCAALCCHRSRIPLVECCG